MTGHLLIDNWTLQNAGELLHNGLSGQTGSEIVFSPDGQCFSYTAISQDVVALECVFQTLQNVVFEERLLVDADFASSWKEFSCFSALTHEGVLATKPFRELEADWGGSREAMADQLCSCPQMREQHEQNKARFRTNGVSPDPMLAQLVWGGAGMLARADYFRVPYTPHPLRERLFTRARFMTGPTQAADQLHRFIDSERLKLFRRMDDSGFYARVCLPAVAPEIVDAASSLEDLVAAALHVRERYSELRRWITEFQVALDAEDVTDMLSRRKVLESVARHVSQLSSLDSTGDTSLQFGLSWIKITTKVPSPVASTKNRFGVRAQIKRLLLAPPGWQSMRRILRLLHEERSARGATLLNDLMARQGTSSVDRSGA